MSTLSIRRPRANQLARQLASMRGVTISDAVESALEAAVKAEPRRETAIESAQRILKEHGLSFPPNRQPVPQSAYHEFDHDLIGEDD